MYPCGWMRRGFRLEGKTLSPRQVDWMIFMIGFVTCFVFVWEFLK